LRLLRSVIDSYESGPSAPLFAFALGVLLLCNVYSLAHAETSGAADVGWGIQAPVEMDATKSNAVIIATDLAGRTMAVWLEGNNFSWGRGDSVWARQFIPGTGWGPTTRIDNGSSAYGDPSVAVDDFGNAFATWTRFAVLPNGTYSWAVWANRFTPDAGWLRAIPLTNRTIQIASPDLSMEPSGNTVVAWGENDFQSHNNLYVRRFSVNEGWQPPELVGSFDHEVADLDVEVDPQGNVLIVFLLRNVQTWDSDLRAARFSIKTGWEAVRPIETFEGMIFDPVLKLDATGNAIVLFGVPNQYSEFDGIVSTFINLYANRYVQGVGWGTPAKIEEWPWAVERWQLSVSASGFGVALWYGLQPDYRFPTVWVTRVSPAGEWSKGVQLADSVISGGLDVAIDSEGNALAVWSSLAGRRNYVLSSRFRPNSGWSYPVEMGYNDNASTSEPSVVMDGSGNAVAVWLSGDWCPVEEWYCSTYQRDIWSNRFVEGDGAVRLEVGSDQEPLTNNPDVTLTGRSDPGLAVRIDGESVLVGRDGSFSWTTRLPDGTHTFVVRAQDLAGIQRTVMLTITVDTTAPLLVVTSPSEETFVHVSTIAVSGMTEPGMRVEINEVVANVDPNGAFGVIVALRPGVNHVVVKATDPAGNVATSTLQVTFIEAVPLDQGGVLMLLGLVALSFVLAIAGVILHRRRRTILR